jgi:GNAT superfamily N-acetyltransferase
MEDHMLVNGGLDAGLCEALVVPVVLRPYLAGDHGQVMELLRDLPELYPGGDRWLARRLAAAADGQARVTVAVLRVDRRVPVGVTIETPKPGGRMKLSTLYVAPVARGGGVGTRLIAAAEARWAREGVRRVHVTADESRAGAVERVIAKAGFHEAAVERGRYAADRSEVVFVRRA